MARNPFLNTLQALGLYGNAAPAPTNIEGIPPEMMGMARSQALTGVGGQLLAAGFSRDPRARAEALAGISEAGDMSRPIYNMAQARLMSMPKERALDTQIIEANGRRLIVNKQTGEIVKDLGAASSGGSDGGDGPKYGYSQVWVDMEDGRGPQPYAQGNDGTLKELQLPENARALPPMEIAGGRTQAQEQAKAGQAAPGALNMVKSGIKQIDELLAMPGLETATGENQGLLPDAAFAIGSNLPGEWGQASSDALAARRRIQQVKGQAFLLGYETLKGTGQITEIEGQKAEEAKARLQTANSDEEYLQALADFRDALSELVPIIEAKAGRYMPSQSSGGGAPPPAGGGQPQQGGGPPPLAQRVQGQVYQTPRGPMVWTGSGWAPAGDQ